MTLKIRIIFLFSISLCFNYASFSQIDLSATKKSNSWIFELNFGRSENNEKFQFDNIEIKYLLNNKIGLKLSARIENNRTILTEDDNTQNQNSTVTVFENAFQFSIKPGVEYRIPLNQKISAYCGIDFLYSQKISESEYSEFVEYYDGYNITHVDGAWRGPYDYFYYSNFERERAHRSFGAYAIFGSDIYLYHNFFLGFELGYGYEITKYKTVHMESISQWGESEKNYPSYSNSKLGFNLNNLIRIGIRF